MPAEVSGGGSLVSRLDTVTRDYKVAFSLGPTGLGDTSLGHHTFPWRARLVGNDVLVSRVNTAGTAWDVEQVLFSYEGIEGSEIDVAFDQNGAALVAFDRYSTELGIYEVWLYWFDPRVGSNSLQLIGPGRTPRLVLDDVESTGESDVVLFYLNDVSHECEYRTQRELFEIVAVVPSTVWYDAATRVSVVQPATEFMKLEEVLRSTDHRVHVVASLRNPVTGRYSLIIAETQPYPIPARERMSVSGFMWDAETKVIIIEATPALEDLALTGVIGSLLLYELTLEAGPAGDDGYLDADELSVQGQLTDAAVQDLVLRVGPAGPNGYYDEEALEVSGLVLDAETEVIVIVADDQEPELLEVAGQISTATVSVP